MALDPLGHYADQDGPLAAGQQVLDALRAIVNYGMPDELEDFLENAAVALSDGARLEEHIYACYLVVAGFLTGESATVEDALIINGFDPATGLRA